MKIYCCQLDLAWENKRANFEAARCALRVRTVVRGSLVLLPEMFPTGFSMSLDNIAETSANETEAFLGALAQELGVFLLAGLVTRGPDGKGRNQALAIDPTGRRLTCYTKLHPFTYGGESRYYEPGQEISTFAWNGMTVMPLICYDLRFPEVFRAGVRRGAELFAVLANWPQAREAHWLALLRARAIENQAYVAGVNRIGNDPKTAYAGRSTIFGPRGEMLADAGGAAAVIEADVDRAALAAYRQEFPALADMRADLLPPLG